MNIYHINPETGEPGLCKAKIKCRFGNRETEHYCSKEEARQAYENFMKYSNYNYLQLLNERNLLQTKILKDLKGEDDDESYAQTSELIKTRNLMDNLIKNYVISENSNKSSGGYDDSVYEFTPLSFERNGDKILGINNDITQFNDDFPETSKQIENICREWVSRLTEKQLQELWNYSQDSSNYSKLAAHDKKYNNEFNKIIESAPRINPITTYSGLSYETRRIIIEQLRNNSVKIKIPKAISTTLNPAQVNGFMLDEEDEFGNVALAIETNRGAFLQTLSFNADEFEVLVSRGEFEVTKIEKDIKIFWDDKFGRTVNTLIHLKKL